MTRATRWRRGGLDRPPRGRGNAGGAAAWLRHLGWAGRACHAPTTAAHHLRDVV